MYCSCIEVAVCRIPGGKHESPLELHPHHNPKHHWKILLLLVDQPDGNYLRNMYLHLLITQIFPYPNNIGFVCPRELIWNSSVSIFICPARSILREQGHLRWTTWSASQPHNQGICHGIGSGLQEPEKVGFCTKKSRKVNVPTSWNVDLRFPFIIFVYNSALPVLLNTWVTEFSITDDVCGFSNCAVPDWNVMIRIQINQKLTLYSWIMGYNGNIIWSDVRRCLYLYVMSYCCHFLNCDTFSSLLLKRGEQSPSSRTRGYL